MDRTKWILASLFTMTMGMLLANSPMIAQDKKDPPKVLQNDKGEKVGIKTNDGLSLGGLWFPASSKEEKRNKEPDAVIMMPDFGHEVYSKHQGWDMRWVNMAEKISQKGFGVLLFDWRGHGMSGPDIGTRIFTGQRQTLFEKDLANRNQWGAAVTTIDAIDCKYFKPNYWPFLFNDLAAARYYLDQKNDNQAVNSGRIWIVTEGRAAHFASGFIASEFRRNSVYTPNNLTAVANSEPAGVDYAGLVALSFNISASTPKYTPNAAAMTTKAASSTFNYNHRVGSADPYHQRCVNHMNDRLAALLIYAEKDTVGKNTSNQIMNRLHQFRGTPKQIEAERKERFKWVESVKGAKNLTGIDLISDDLGTMQLIETFMEKAPEAQALGKNILERNAKEAPSQLPVRFNTILYGLGN
ncbi:MAG: hypothetical protein R3B84_00035 [Zavarzinella sp.]